MVGGGIGHDEGGGIDKGEVGRQRHAHGGGCQRMRGEPARARKTGHMLAHLEMFDTFAHGLHHAGVFRARHKGQGRLDLVFVLHDQQIGKVQAGSLDFQQHLAGAGLRCGLLGPFQCFDAGGGGAEPCVHILSPDLLEVRLGGIGSQMIEVWCECRVSLS